MRTYCYLLLAILISTAFPAFSVETKDKPKIDWHPYMEKLHKKVRKYWLPPESTTPSHVILEWKILRNGSITGLKVKQHGPSKIDDYAAQQKTQSSTQSIEQNSKREFPEATKMAARVIQGTNGKTSNFARFHRQDIQC